MPIKLILSILLLAVLAGLSCREPGTIQPTPGAETRADAININTATEQELQRIPHVGESLARAIIEFRNTHGPFRRAEELMLVDGISDARFRRIRENIRVD